ncbi:MAG: hypothetical protein ACOYNY_11660 [Caldilineaceae bacterium]
MPSITAPPPVWVVNRTSLLRAGLYEATHARLYEVEATLAEAKAHLQRFEQQYGLSFANFERDLLPTLDSPQAHEDYLDWFFWHSVWAEQRALLTKLQL